MMMLACAYLLSGLNLVQEVIIKVPELGHRLMALASTVEGKKHVMGLMRVLATSRESHTAEQRAALEPFLIMDDQGA
jgi:hypothetical protein